MMPHYAVRDVNLEKTIVAGHLTAGQGKVPLNRPRVNVCDGFCHRVRLVRPGDLAVAFDARETAREALR